ncbi:Immunoglobulin domain containing protein [Euroglyphus maynei]|uniref:Immunoglobulin domain containing protein n=1 Tax=Euroglyphus maynei TaxID=6958 RepID=A0A1Y3BK54_EURMA|nr:Immunoglobulin domain containing protein [Euroglyphus maynei]
MFKLLLFCVSFWVIHALKDAPRISKSFSKELIQSEGSVLNIPCSILSGSPPFSFKWFKNGNELQRTANQDSYQIKTDNFLSFLSISQLRAIDSGNYSCIVSNDYGIDIQWTILQVKAIETNEAPSLLKQLSRLSSAKGSDIVLTCNVAKGTKPFRFQWHKDNVEISDNKHSRIEIKDIYSFLTLYNIDREDIGNYSCIVTNQFGFDRISFQLDVTGLNFY